MKHKPRLSREAELLIKVLEGTLTQSQYETVRKKMLTSKSKPCIIKGNKGVIK